MTFADIATQDPVGEQATFDPEVGEASVVVPEVEPGLWALAAACVGPETEADALIEAIQELGAILEELGAPATHPDTLEMVEFFREHFDLEGSFFEVFVEGLQLIGPTVLEPIMVPDALGAVGFCVLDAEGNCPADEPPAPPPGEPPTEGPFAGEPAPAQPVVAAPTFTG